MTCETVGQSVTQHYHGLVVLGLIIREPFYSVISICAG